MTPVAGLLLSGGASRRMGHDKASIRVAGESSAHRAARLLGSVANPVWEVGPSHCHLPHVREDPAGSGPVSAVAAGWTALSAAGHRGPVLVLACDLPLMTRELLEWLAGHPVDRTVIPMVGGRPQPVCARWSGPDLDRLVQLQQSGYRSFKPMYETFDIVFVEPDDWKSVGPSRLLADTDTPDDLRRLGIEWEAGEMAPGWDGSRQGATVR
ncbi:MAG TPA: molybdenum cofactor guanylyltransferase [Acidimicrobiales bacterium]|nr:molybdenum cofactor guanylyltransferase [Acidimicrobiales bacterium]